MTIVRLLIVAMLSGSTSVWAHNNDGFFPENNLWIGENQLKFRGMTEQQFTQTLGEIETLFRPIVAAKGGQLKFYNAWSKGTVNAFANRENGEWQVFMFGGLARHDAVTLDALALIACHELGHHLGGSPRIDNNKEWASVEGQSDYFSTAKCLRKLWKGKANKVSNEDPKARSACAKFWSNAADQDLCVRIAMAGESAAEMGRQLEGGSGPVASIDTPDPKRVSTVFEDHPAYQCRLDTYVRGALCTENEDNLASACAQPEQSRPACWFPGGGNTGGGDEPGGEQPSGEIALSPLLNGRNAIRVNNPAQPVSIQWNVSSFPGAGGVFVEVSRPNTTFSNPNDVNPDPQRLLGFAVKGARGGTQIVPARQLPSWGQYLIRVIPLNSTGNQSVGRFSNPSILQLGR